MEGKLSAFAKRYAGFGVHRMAIKANKTNQYAVAIETCRSSKFTVEFASYIQGPYEKMAANVKKQMAAAAAAAAKR